ncbi:MAG: 3-hydroxyacyl-CoA dehydrogenase family protein [Deltaproteobacteria bacterium]|nr:3-hydroxyacyl-CoA dehydrogenase family protein [Deltaproteobacteria bacterium]
MKKIGVIGAGAMGAGIAQVFALHGFETVLMDRTEAALKAALERISTHTDPLLWDKVRSFIKTSTDMKDIADCDVVIEAVFEEAGIKKEVLKKLSAVCRPQSIIATNTSSISIDELAGSVTKPERFIGMHFMNPPKVMKLVEIIKGSMTSQDTLKAITDLSVRIEKTPAVVKDSPGFITNRLLFAFLGEAMRLFECGNASKEDIDTAMKFGMNHPMGPIELADFIGLDVCLEIMEYLHTHLKDEKFKPPDILSNLVKEGKLGRKTKEGFYRYER